MLDERMPRSDSLTGLRWWAAFVVFTYHMLNLAPLPTAIAQVLVYGHYGVTFFFVLSGFVLTWSASNRVPRSTFYWRRVARIYPSHLVALALAIPVFYSFMPDPADSWVKPVNVGILALSVVLLQGWSRDPVILFSGNPAAWTLTCEAFFYALHPFILKALMPLRVRGALLFVGGVAAVALAYRALVASDPQAWFSAAPLPVVHLSEFALGMGIAWAFRRGWRPRVSPLIGLAGMALVLGLIVFAPVLAPGSLVAVLASRFASELIAMACGLLIVAYAAHSLSGARSLMASRPLVLLGEWSYAFYLVHATLVYTALAIFGFQGSGWRNLAWYAALLVVSIALAAALHYLVEKPAERRMRAWKDARDARRVVTP